jgi:hypothetical protein
MTLMRSLGSGAQKTESSNDDTPSGIDTAPAIERAAGTLSRRAS